MTDDQQWQAPSSSVAPPASLPASLPSPPPGPPAHGGWTPPPKPGLVPLRPMTLGTMLGGAFQTLRRNPATTLVPALVVKLVVALVQALGSAGFLTQYLGILSDPAQNSRALGAGARSTLTSGILGFVLTSLGAAVLSLITTAIVQAIVTVQIGGSTLGARLRLAALWGHLRGRRGAVIGWATLSGGVVVVAILVIGGVAVLLGLTGTAGVIIGIVLALIAGLGLLVVGVWLWVKLGFVPAAIVLERASIRQSMRRSWRLTRGAFWRIFGIRLLVLAMVYVATQIIATPISLAITLSGGVLAPNGATDAAASHSLLISLIATQAVTAVISAVGLVLSTATGSLLYLDQRMRVEGLDLELARYIERRQAGEHGLPDPYIPVGGAE